MGKSCPWYEGLASGAPQALVTPLVGSAWGQDGWEPAVQWSCAALAPNPGGELRGARSRPGQPQWLFLGSRGLPRLGPHTGGGSTLLTLCLACREVKPGARSTLSPASYPSQAVQQPCAAPAWVLAQLTHSSPPGASLGLRAQPRGRRQGQKNTDSISASVLPTSPLAPVMAPQPVAVPESLEQQLKHFLLLF